MAELIGMVGPLGGGKTTVAKILAEDFGFTRMRMADTLKRMLRVAGLTEAQVDGDEKMIPCDLLCGKTPRWAMQTLGTEWARECIGEDFWVNCMEQTLLEAGPNAKIVIDDIRFHNEVDMVRRFSGVLFRVQGHEAPPPTPTLLDRFATWFTGEPLVHPSELYWKTFEVDFEIDNRFSLEGLRLQVKNAYGFTLARVT